LLIALVATGKAVVTIRLPVLMDRWTALKFCKIAASGAPETVNNGVITGRSMRIPYSTEQGIILAEQGILAREQGILSAGIGIIAG
jgi:hypothetical protein